MKTFQKNLPLYVLCSVFESRCCSAALRHRSHLQARPRVRHTSHKHSDVVLCFLMWVFLFSHTSAVRCSSHIFSKLLDGFKLSAERLFLCAARRLHISFCGVQRGQPTSIMFSCFCSGAPRWKYSNAASVGTSVIDRSVCMVVSACVWVFTSSPLRCWSQS